MTYPPAVRTAAALIAIFATSGCGARESADRDSAAGPEADSVSDTGISAPDAGTPDAGTPDGGPDFQPPANVVLFIGDGMGQSHVAAAGIYLNGASGTLFFESFPAVGLVNTASANAAVTDSAAAATAMGCGRKVNNFVVALALPGDGEPLSCLVDFFKQRGKSTGLVTTTYLTHATPAAFAAHARDRLETAEIARQYLETGRPELMFGGGGYGLSAGDAMEAGYRVWNSLDGYDPTAYEDGRTLIAGLFGEGFYPYEVSEALDRPHLYESAVAAVRTLAQDPDGFFVMIEGGMIDQGAHANRLDLTVGETVAFERAVREVVAAVDLGETLVIVTSDHATGDLQIVQNNGQGLLPRVSWGTRGHDGSPVKIFATGKGADAVAARIAAGGGTIENTEIHELITAPFQ